MLKKNTSRKNISNGDNVWCVNYSSSLEILHFFLSGFCYGYCDQFCDGGFG